jgi:hypothetical protein
MRLRTDVVAAQNDYSRNMPRQGNVQKAVSKWLQLSTKANIGNDAIAASATSDFGCPRRFANASNARTFLGTEIDAELCILHCGRSKAHAVIGVEADRMSDPLHRPTHSTRLGGFGIGVFGTAQRSSTCRMSEADQK